MRYALCPARQRKRGGAGDMLMRRKVAWGGRAEMWAGEVSVFGVGVGVVVVRGF